MKLAFSYISYLSCFVLYSFLIVLFLIVLPYRYCALLFVLCAFCIVSLLCFALFNNGYVDVKKEYNPGPCFARCCRQRQTGRQAE